MSGLAGDNLGKAFSSSGFLRQSWLKFSRRTMSDVLEKLHEYDRAVVQTTGFSIHGPRGFAFKNGKLTEQD